ncbi:MAG: hypothetical protein H0W83_10055 [Planctomycetes bacterium]|nr:hypothetical protein [Planctomycetota bacterium]
MRDDPGYGFTSRLSSASEPQTARARAVGGTASADLARFAYRPDLVVDSVADIVPLLEQLAAS